MEEVEDLLPPQKRRRLAAVGGGSHAVHITEARVEGVVVDLTESEGEEELATVGGEVVDLTESEGEEELVAAGGVVSTAPVDLRPCTRDELPMRCSTPVIEEEEEEEKEKDDLDATLDYLGLSQQSVDSFIAAVDEGEEGEQKESDVGYQTGEKEGEGKEEEGEDLDTTLDSLGLSHECVDSFIDDVDEESNGSSKQSSQREEEKERGEGGKAREAGREDGANYSLDEFGLDENCALQFLREEGEEVEVDDVKESSSHDDGGGCRLPLEVLELILAQLPFSQLYFSCRLVCHVWNDIIRREKFLYWKKMYYMYKSGSHDRARETVTALAHKLWPAPDSDYCKSLDSITGPLARYVSERFVHMEVGEAALASLRTHPQSHCVDRIQKIGLMTRSEKGSPAVETIVLLTVCSASVHEVLTILHSLLTPHKLHPPPCDRIKVMELFYCMATLLWAAIEKGVRIPMRYHYHMFYALNVLERGPCSVAASDLLDGPGGRQQRGRSPSSEVPLTAEQAQVVTYDLKPKEVVKIKAFAGTGKTTTLLQLTQLNPHKQYLYCVYNKSVQQHASLLFPSNVKCRTFHSLAHGSMGDPSTVGWRYWSKKGDLSAYKISQWVEQYPESQGPRPKKKAENTSLYCFSKAVLQTLEKFIASSDEQLAEDHVPSRVRMRGSGNGEDRNNQEERFWPVREPALVLQEAQKIWRKMVDCNNKKVLMPDDGYLKLYQLRKPQISGYDCILVDEAQDLTPAIISLITYQRCSKIFVGDTHQQIYGFRGATNALERIVADHVFYLTESFRFGPKIAYVAACVLSALKGVKRQTLVGSLHRGRIDGAQCGQLAVLARLNATLFDEMVKAVKSGRKLKLGFAGGIEKYELDMYVDIHRLMLGQKKDIKHKFVKKWNSFQDLQRYAERTDDVALINKIRMCEKYCSELPGLIESIRSKHCRDTSKADIVFSTVHKSKGLEFDTVRVTDDFCIYDDREDDRHCRLVPGHLNTEPEVEEKNLLYVAVTRAKKSLILTPTLVRVLKEAKEWFVHPTMENCELEKGICGLCHQMQPYPALHLQSLQMTIAGQNGLRPTCAGMVCTFCASETLPSLYH